LGANELGKVFSELDCEFAETANGELGLAKVRECLPDLILLDVTMPGMDGFEVCRALRAQPGSAAIPVLMLTGMNDNASIQKAFEVGASDFFTKPLNLTILGHRIRYMLRASLSGTALRSSEQRLSNAQRISMIGEWEMDLARNDFAPSDRLRQMLGLSHDNFLSSLNEFTSIFDQSEQAGLSGSLEKLVVEYIGLRILMARLDWRIEPISRHKLKLLAKVRPVLG
jgi:DNA-binding response OmpR family regulator